MRRFLFILSVAGLVALVAAVCLNRSSRPVVERCAGPLPNEVYVWQRRWDDAVVDAVMRGSKGMREMAVLAAEVSWQGGSPSVVRVPVDWEALRDADRPVGLVLRVGACPSLDGAAVWLNGLAATLVAEARDHGVEPAELQVDYDCAESRLGHYRRWVAGLREAVRPVPVAITALPCWLARSEFAPLARAAGGFILQVHSLEKPAGLNAPLVLCDAVAARRWVEAAARADVPFRVALPTYGYLVAFAPDGRFLGISAEGPAPSWPKDAVIRSARADAGQLADLVQTLQRDRPAALTGVIWYRLPVEGDRLNWSLATLSIVMSGRRPQGTVAVEITNPEPGLAEVTLVNRGEADAEPLGQVRVDWAQDRLAAADGLRGYAFAPAGAGRCVFARGASGPEVLAPGERWTIGWLRFEDRTEVTAHVASIEP